MSVQEDNQLACRVTLFAPVAAMTIVLDDKNGMGLHNCFFVVQRAVR
ncbi:hypothetical protein IFT98_06370 [Pseudomonas sp. CFBP 8770]|nr:MULTISPECIES: hypothetical protein [unclassified Pseudomonas]MBD8473478.1 hypothetical protein [Pseudomonas sp. CFBP 8773]MBD8646605.1 hypothetical protein [Pseudomonas sp. CFBP 8770]